MQIKVNVSRNRYRSWFDWMAKMMMTATRAHQNPTILMQNSVDFSNFHTKKYDLYMRKYASISLISILGRNHPPWVALHPDTSDTRRN